MTQVEKNVNEQVFQFAVLKSCVTNVSLIVTIFYQYYTSILASKYYSICKFKPKSEILLFEYKRQTNFLLNNVFHKQ